MEEVVPLVRGMEAENGAFLALRALTGEDLAERQVEAVQRGTSRVIGRYVGAGHAELPPETQSELSRIHKARRR